MTSGPPHATIIEVVAYCADLNNSTPGVLHVLALVRSTDHNRDHAPLGRVYWGVLDLVVGEDEGAQINLRSYAESRSSEDFVRAYWHDVDWHPDQASASDAYRSARLRDATSPALIDRE